MAYSVSHGKISIIFFLSYHPWCFQIFTCCHFSSLWRTYDHLWLCEYIHMCFLLFYVLPLKSHFSVHSILVWKLLYIIFKMILFFVLKSQPLTLSFFSLFLSYSFLFFLLSCSLSFCLPVSLCLSFPLSVFVFLHFLHPSFHLSIISSIPSSISFFFL